MRTIRPNQLASFRATLKQAFDSPSKKLLTRTLTTPGGAIRNAEVIWRPDIGLWAYFSPNAYDRKRWLGWYGLDPGLPDQTIRPAVEINLDIKPAYKQVSGRALVDPLTGDFFLGHRGGLGGGRGGQMTVADFATHIRGFARDSIQLGETREEEVFALGNLGNPDFLRRLRAYVAECERLRAWAKAGRHMQPPTNKIDQGFRPECDQDGYQQRRPAEVRAIRRRHGRVVNALKAELGAKATNSSFMKMRPDLYINDAAGAMQVLFEVKASSDTQSWFTALGQLLVYGAGQRKPPRRILVCPAPLQEPAFQLALKQLGVRLVTFDDTRREDIQFYGLAAALE